jgi:hypothetical protein
MGTSDTVCKNLIVICEPNNIKSVIINYLLHSKFQITKSEISKIAFGTLILTFEFEMQLKSTEIIENTTMYYMKLIEQ